MLPREFVEVLLGGLRAASLHILDALLNRLDGLVVVLTLPFEVLGQCFVESIGGRLSTSTRKLLEFGEPLGLDRQRPHDSKVELREPDVNAATWLAVGRLRLTAFSHGPILLATPVL